MGAASPPKPIIAVSIGFHEFGDYLGVGFQRPIADAGGVPVILPRLIDSIEDVLGACSGLMLTGGRDIAPEHYGHAPQGGLGAPDPSRDAFELPLVRSAMRRGLPIIGVCRGLQILNVALGGTLVQDVGLVDAWIDHPADPTLTSWRGIVAASLADTPLPEHPRHDITVTPGSLLHEALGVSRIGVNSFHHQVVDVVAPALRVTARADDGVIEALEGDGFVLAMQCELHEEWRVQPQFLQVFRNFVVAAADYAAGRSQQSSMHVPAAR